MTVLYKPRPERWPQVSLKGFFVLVTLLGVLLGWLGVQVKWIRDRHEAMEWLWQHDGAYLRSYRHCSFDEAVSRLMVMGVRAVHIPEPNWHAVDAPWSLKFFNEDGVSAIALNETADEAMPARARELERLFPEAKVFVGTDIVIAQNRDYR